MDQGPRGGGTLAVALSWTHILGRCPPALRLCPRLQRPLCLGRPPPEETDICPPRHSQEARRRRVDGPARSSVRTFPWAARPLRNADIPLLPSSTRPPVSCAWTHTDASAEPAPSGGTHPASLGRDVGSGCSRAGCCYPHPTPTPKSQPGAVSERNDRLISRELRGTPIHVPETPVSPALLGVQERERGCRWAAASMPGITAPTSAVAVGVKAVGHLSEELLPEAGSQGSRQTVAKSRPPAALDGTCVRLAACGCCEREPTYGGAGGSVCRGISSALGGGLPTPCPELTVAEGPSPPIPSPWGSLRILD